MRKRIAVISEGVVNGVSLTENPHGNVGEGLQQSVAIGHE